MNSNRVYYTPRVEIGSEQYWADVAFIQSFYSYEDYLNYMKDEPDVENFLNKDMTRASRRKVTARRHRRSVKNSKIPNHKESITWKSDKACYKRARILQPQCVELENIMLDDFSNYYDLGCSFDTFSERLTYSVDFSKMFPTYGDYLYSIARNYVEQYSKTILGLEVSGLRISEHPTGNYSHPISAKYAKRTDCLFGKKKKKSQDKQAEFKVKKATEAAKIAEDTEAKKAAWATGFTTFNGEILDYSDEQSDSDEESIINVHGSYCSPRHRSSSHPIIVPRFAVKETKIQIKMVSTAFIPIFF